MNNIEEFADTQHRIAENDVLKNKATESQLNTLVYGEGYLSSKIPNKGVSSIEVTEESTFEAARRLATYGRKIATLNFANPFTPGGGVLHGANAQEECLCRMSTLYDCLTSDNAKQYYEKNAEIHSLSKYKSIILASDLIIYSPNITIIKQEIVEDGRRVLAYTANWIDVDVVTCAAPCFVFQGLINNFGFNNLFELFVKRIKNILEVCIEQQIEVLVLGAFGCGAFHNPPEVVAYAFKEVLNEERYKNAFSKVVFAILTGKSKTNYETFYKIFQEKI